MSQGGQSNPERYRQRVSGHVFAYPGEVNSGLRRGETNQKPGLTLQRTFAFIYQQLNR